MKLGFTIDLNLSNIFKKLIYIYIYLCRVKIYLFYEILTQTFFKV